MSSLSYGGGVASINHARAKVSGRRQSGRRGEIDTVTTLRLRWGSVLSEPVIAIKPYP